MKTIEDRLEALKETAKRDPKMEQDIYAAVDRLDDNTPRFPLSPSQVLKPARDLYYDLCNFFQPGSVPRDPIPARVKILFQVGHIIEATIVKYFKEAVQVKGEQERVTFGKLSDGRELSGAIDWAIVVNGETILCDSKSIGDFPFKSAPKEDNIAQMQLYMHSDWGRKNNVNRALLVYVNKNDSELKIMEIAYDAELAEQLLAKLNAVYEAYLKKQIPPREYVLGLDWRADYSGYVTYDNAEFAGGTERDVADAHLVPPGPAPKISPSALRHHVLTYGSNTVEYGDGTCHYVRLTQKKDKYGREKKTLELVIEGQEQNWKAV